MPTEQQPQEPTLTAMPEAEQQFRTIAVRVEENLHTQLSFIAQLSGSNLSEEVRKAIEVRIATAQDDPELVAKAQRAREEIEREAKARSAAIAGFMGQAAVAAAPARSQRTTKTSNE